LFKQEQEERNLTIPVQIVSQNGLELDTSAVKAGSERLDKKTKAPAGAFLVQVHQFEDKGLWWPALGD
jgi:hypothetical protein